MTKMIRKLVSIIVLAGIIGLTVAGCHSSTHEASREAGGEDSTVPAASKTLPDDSTQSAEQQCSELSLSVPASRLRDFVPAELMAEMQKANPGFRGEVIVENQDGAIVVAINDPEVRDIAPLTGLRIHKLDLYQCSLSDLTPLRGLPITAMALDRTKVTDLRPLAGMPLEYLSLSETEVSDISPLSGCPLKQLNLVRTKVTDLTPLARCPLQTLWLNDTPVSDLSPLRSVPLESLTIAGTKVSDLNPLKGMPLKRLHIARSEVIDLTPLRWLRLERFIFTPSKIQSGMDVVRGMATLREIGTAFGESDWGIADRVMPAAEFWALFDAGQIKD
ncbi:MAG: leucine-rich repeat domain-containing protein [Thermogutta sp.]